MMSRVVSMVRWRAVRLMGIVLELDDGSSPSSRSSERKMWPGLALGESGLHPNRRVDCEYCRLICLWRAGIAGEKLATE